MDDMPGLTIHHPDGREWKWVGHSTVENQRGETVRVEHWEGACRFCQAPYTIRQKAPAVAVRRYQRAAAEPVKPGRVTDKHGHTLRYIDRPLQVKVTVPPQYSFATRTCLEHRGWNKHQFLASII